MEKYVVLEKQVGETPLSCLENWRAEQIASSRLNLELADVPMAYAGRLDPMASGKLLVLLGDECKKQKNYHGLDKEYLVEVLFGVSSDSGDVLGIVTEEGAPQVSEADLRRTLATFIGLTTFPYPKFSSKTVQGKPLHTWTVEGRLNEIEIPTYTATIYRIKLESLITKTRAQVYHEASAKIETIPPVTDPRKALGNDFRRPDVRAAWKAFQEARTCTKHHPTPSSPRSDLGLEGVSTANNQFSIATIRVTGSAGLYMRTLAEEIAKRLNTSALAYSIHRSKIGNFQQLPFTTGGFWLNTY